MVPLDPFPGQLPSSRRGLANGPALGWRALAGAPEADHPGAPGPKEKEKEAEDAHLSASLQAAAPRGAALSSATPRGALRHLAGHSGAAEEVPAPVVTAMSHALSTGRGRPRPGTCLGDGTGAEVPLSKGEKQRLRRKAATEQRRAARTPGDAGALPATAAGQPLELAEAPAAADPQAAPQSASDASAASPQLAFQRLRLCREGTRLLRSWRSLVSHGHARAPPGSRPGKGESVAVRCRTDLVEEVPAPVVTAMSQELSTIDAPRMRQLLGDYERAGAFAETLLREWLNGSFDAHSPWPQGAASTGVACTGVAPQGAAATGAAATGAASTGAASRNLKVVEIPLGTGSAAQDKDKNKEKAGNMAA